MAGGKTSSHNKHRERKETSKIQEKLDVDLLVNLGNSLLYIGATLIVFSSEDDVQLFAAYIKLIAGALFIKASALQADLTAYRNAAGSTVITSLAKQRIIGSLLGELSGILLTDVLQKELSMKNQPNTGIPPFFV